MRAAGGRIRFGEAVREVRWRRSVAEVRTARGTHRAAAVVVTVPIGVLRAGIPRFRPGLPDKRHAIARVGWGEVARITLRFRPDWWRRGPLPPALRSRGRAAFGFLFRLGEDFPAWWASNPAVPMLVGWSGGPAARRLTRRPVARWRGPAMASLARILGISVAKLRPWVVGSWAHNWSADPHARGAYSHPPAGREAARRRLARPMAATLFFAGEATAEESGTMQGALNSGRRAAEEVLAAPRARPQPRAQPLNAAARTVPE